MRSATGAPPPLHRRFNETDALLHIRNRYQACRDMIHRKQLSLLQKNQAFVAQVDRLYKQDYKDWMIGVIIYNIIMNRHFVDTEVDLLDRSKSIAAMKAFATQRKRKIYPAVDFLGDNFDRARMTFFGTALVIWGFHPRAQRIDPAAIEMFLRQRMRFFEFDLPHDPLFGSPPGDWPVVD